MSGLHDLNKNNSLVPERLILGIDPGTNIMGYGILLIKGNSMELVDMGVFSLQKLDEQADKLKKIFEEVIVVIEKHKPDEMAIEAPFFGKNVQSMLKLGRAQGVAYAAALSRNIPVSEYSPTRIKQSITGRGQSSKEQVAAMLASMLRIKETPKYLDATDALAVAVCHYFQRGPTKNGKASSGKTVNGKGTSKNYSGWSSFLNANPDRKK
jgi:crossover junction endodeoxyribonuclease RuvC